jgi:hypothetical protein
MSTHRFRPSLNDVLEDRLALTYTGAAGVANATVANPRLTTPAHPVLRSGALVDVNQKIDIAFVGFSMEYRKEFVRVHKSGHMGRFQSELASSASKLRLALDREAGFIPGGTQTLTATLNARVDRLLQDLSTHTTQSSFALISSEQSGAHADVATYVLGEVAEGVLSVR